MIYVEPDCGPAPVIHFVEAAQDQLLINDYYLNDIDVTRAISEDVRRGVKVTVIIAGNPYGQSRNVKGEEAALIKAGATVQIAPAAFEGKNGHTSYDHAKYAVTSTGALIGTANWDNSAFATNREYLFITKNSAIIKALTAIFVIGAKPGAAAHFFLASIRRRGFFASCAAAIRPFRAKPSRARGSTG